MPNIFFIFLTIYLISLMIWWKYGKSDKKRKYQILGAQFLVIAIVGIILLALIFNVINMNTYIWLFMLCFVCLGVLVFGFWLFILMDFVKVGNKDTNDNFFRK